MHKPLRIHKTTMSDGTPAFTSSGSPTDCVALVMGGMLDIMPDIVVSGINAGHNIGIDVTYSGTVACAMEAVIKGVPGVAVSTCFPSDSKADIDLVRRMAAAAACQVALRVLQHGLPEHTLVNVNVPGLDPDQVKGLRITHMGGRRYDAREAVERHDPFGQPYYWLGVSRPDR